MFSPTYFVQGCPTCGRRLQVRVEYLGRKVICQHCRGPFIASDPNSSRADQPAPIRSLLKRAEELLEQAEQKSKALKSG